jgi:hypothetical protein
MGEGEDPHPSPFTLHDSLLSILYSLLSIPPHKPHLHRLGQAVQGGIQLGQHVSLSAYGRIDQLLSIAIPVGAGVVRLAGVEKMVTKKPGYLPTGKVRCFASNQEL